MNKKYIILMLLMSLLLIVGFSLVKNLSGFNQTPQSNHISIGATAPDFSLPTLSGQALSLEEFRGKTVIINFWASTCHDCQAEFPTLEKFNEQHGNGNVVLLSINDRETPDAVKKFLEKGNYQQKVLLDPEGKVVSAYAVRAISTKFLIDPDGKIKDIFLGRLTLEQLNQWVETGKL